MKIFLAILLSCLPCLSARAVDVYVDNAATGANNGSSWANAYTSFTSLVGGLGPGTNVYISGGTTSKVYGTNDLCNPDGDTKSIIYISNAGSAAGGFIRISAGSEAPVDASSHNGKVILDWRGGGRRADTVVMQSYCILDGGANTNIWIINNTNLVTKDYNKAVTLGSVRSMVLRCGISNVNNGIHVSSSCTSNLVSWNYMTNVLGDLCIGWQSDYEHFFANEVCSNTVYATSHYDLDSVIEAPPGTRMLGGSDCIKASKGAYVHHNKCRTATMGWHFGGASPGVHPITQQHPDTFQTANDANHQIYFANDLQSPINSFFELGLNRRTTNVIIAFNKGVLIETNFWQGGHNIMEMTSEGWTNEWMVGISIFNNTFADMWGGNVWMGMAWDKNSATGGPTNGYAIYFPQVKDVVWHNNVWFNTSRSDTPSVLLGSYANANWNPSLPAQLRFTHNYLGAGDHGGTNVIVGTNEIVSLIGQGTNFQHHWHQVVGDPMFANYVKLSQASDLRPAVGSPLVSSGTNLYAFMASIGIPTEDFDGYPLPSSGAWNVGAFNTNGVAGGGGGGSSPTAPAPLRLKFRK